MAITKQVSIYLTIEEWKALRQQSAESDVSMGRLLYEWAKPKLDKTMSRQGTERNESDDDAG